MKIVRNQLDTFHLTHGVSLSFVDKIALHIGGISEREMLTSTHCVLIFYNF